MTTPQQLQRWTRDDWVIPCTVEDASGTAINLTGKTIAAEFALAGYKVTSDLTVANGGIVRVSDANGQFTVNVPRLLTSRALSDAGLPLSPAPTRVLLYWLDTNLKRQTLGVIPFEVFDGSENLSIDEVPNLTIVYQDASFTIQVASSQGAAGPSSIAAAQITDATAIGRQVLLAATAAAIRTLLGTSNTGRTEVDDVNYNVLATDVYVGYATLTAPRAVHLPPAASFPPGAPGLTIADESGACSSAKPLTVTPYAGDTVAGDPSIILSSPLQAVVFKSNGTNGWTY